MENAFESRSTGAYVYTCELYRDGINWQGRFARSFRQLILRDNKETMHIVISANPRIRDERVRTDMRISMTRPSGGYE